MKIEKIIDNLKIISKKFTENIKFNLNRNDILNNSVKHANNPVIYKKLLEIVNNLDNIEHYTQEQHALLNNLYAYPDLYERFIQYHLDKHYHLRIDSPAILRENKEIALLNIRETNQYDNIELTDQDIEEIIDELIELIPDYTNIENTIFARNITVLRRLIEKDPNNFLRMRQKDLEIHGNNYFDELRDLAAEHNLTLTDITLDELINYKARRDPKLIKNTALYGDIESYLHSAPLEIDGLIDTIVDILIECNYVINSQTRACFKENPKLQLSSYKKDKSSSKYFKKITNPSIIQELQLNNEYETLERCSIDNLPNVDYQTVFKNYFKTFYDPEITELFIKTINEGLSIKNLDKFLDAIALEYYEAKRREAPDAYGNLYHTIKNTLNSEYEFEDFMERLPAYDNLCEVYGREYIEDLFKKLFEYKKKHNKEEYNKIMETINIISREFPYKIKERIIKERKEFFYKIFKKDFIIKLDGPTLEKKIKEKKQREKFFELINKDNNYQDIIENILLKIKSIKTDYKLEEKEIIDLVTNICLNKPLNINKPSKYDELLIQIEVNKIINRLNSGNINEDSYDYIKYKKYIKIRKENNKNIYYTDYFNFTIDELQECNRYIAIQTIIKKTNSFLMPFIKRIEVEITKSDLDNIELDFNDSNYRFDITKLNIFTIENINLIYKALVNIKRNYSKEEYETIIRLIFDNQGLLLSLDNDLHDRGYLQLEYLIKVVTSFKELQTLINLSDINIENISRIKKAGEVLSALKIEEINILGIDLVNNIANNNQYSAYLTTEHKLINVMLLYIETITKNYFTVPRIKGDTEDYHYEIIEQDDPELLQTGYKTASCLRVGGNDNDFLHYCCLNENGLIIKITDQYGNLIARAAGFRNGNGLFLNQLRTIYDVGGNKAKHIDKDFIEKVKKALKTCCDRIIEETKNTDEPIDFVLITKSYILEDCKIKEFGITYTYDLDSKYNETPINLTSKNYLKFLKEHPYLAYSMKEGFTTDYESGYGFIVISATDKQITKDTPKSYDAKPVYRRNRLTISKTILDTNNYYYFNRIKNIKNKINKEKYEPINIEYIGCDIVYGTNWFIIHNDEQILETCVIETDTCAKIEFNNKLNELKSLFVKKGVL